MLWFQVLASIFILFTLQRILSRYQDARIPKSEVLVWVIFWLVIASAVWWPRGTDILANALGISRGYELVVASSLALIFYLTFKLFSHVHKLEGQMTDLVRRLTIEKHEEPREDRHSDESQI